MNVSRTRYSLFMASLLNVGCTRPVSVESESPESSKVVCGTQRSEPVPLGVRVTFKSLSSSERACARSLGYREQDLVWQGVDPSGSEEAIYLSRTQIASGIITGPEVITMLLGSDGYKFHLATDYDSVSEKDRAVLPERGYQPGDVVGLELFPSGRVGVAPKEVFHHFLKNWEKTKGRPYVWELPKGRTAAVPPAAAPEARGDGASMTIAEVAGAFEKLMAAEIYTQAEVDYLRGKLADCFTQDDPVPLAVGVELTTDGTGTLNFRVPSEKLAEVLSPKCFGAVGQEASGASGTVLVVMNIQRSNEGVVATVTPQRVAR